MSRKHFIFPFLCANHNYLLYGLITIFLLSVSYTSTISQELHVFNLSGTENIPFPVTISESSNPIGLSHSGDGLKITVVTEDSKLHVFNLSGTENTPFPVSIPGGGKPTGVSHSNDGLRIAVVTDNSKLHIFNLSGTENTPFPVSISGGGKSTGVSQSNDGLRIAVVTDNSKLHMFNLSGTENTPFPVSIPGGGKPTGVSYSSDGLRVVIITDDSKLHVFNLSGTENTPFPVSIPGGGKPTGVSQSNDGLRIAVVTDDSKLHIFNLSGIENNPFPVSIPGASNPTGVSHSNDGLRIAIVTDDSRLHIFNLSGTENTPFPVMIPGGGKPTGVSQSSDGLRIAVVTERVLPSIIVQIPDGGENWRIGSNQMIQWTSNNLSGNLKIDISRNGGSSFSTITSNTSDDKNYTWQVTGPATTQARIRISSVSNSSINDISDNNFTISESPDLSPPITVDLDPPPGQTVFIPLNLTNTWAVPIASFGLKFYYPKDLLQFVNCDNKGTLTDAWITINCQENTSGEIIIDGHNTAPIKTSGILINVLFKSIDGPGTGRLRLRNFSNDLAGATTTDGMINSTIPVELVSFLAEVWARNVKLTWITASETNNFGFNIERSADGDHYIKIGFVAGKGTTSQPHKYEFYDNEVEPGQYDYRLKQIDTDGAFAYSDIREVIVSSPIEFALNQNYPNPFNSMTMIRYNISAALLVQIKIFNVLGEMVKMLVNDEKAPGFYYVQWDGRDSRNIIMPCAIFVIEMKAGNFIQRRKITLLH